MSAKHTPGPWCVETGDKDSCYAKQWPTIQSDEYEIVGTEGLYGDIDTDIANARLIAAAPDLLDQLRFAVALLKPIFGNTPQVESMESAIAKAIG